MYMPPYRGIVKDKVIVLTDRTELPEGAEVEVRPLLPPPATPDERAREEAFSRHLLKIGMISSLPTREPDPPGLDRTPIRIDGPPLSQTIIEERR
jgi:hypothetical protein